MSIVGRVTILLVVATTLAACERPPATPPSDDGAPSTAPAPESPPAPDPAPPTTPASVGGVATPASSPAGAISNDGAYWVTYAIDLDPIPLNELFSIRLTIYAAGDRNRPLRDVELFVDGRMPEHRHGMNRRPEITRNDDGSFVVNGMLFHMPGYWELHFDVTEDGVTERTQVGLELD